MIRNIAKRLVLPVLLLACGACAGPRVDWEYYPPQPDRRSEPPRDKLVVEPGSAPDVQYAGFCMEENLLLNDWVEGEAHTAAAEHANRFPRHHTTVLWRQKP